MGLEQQEINDIHEAMFAQQTPTDPIKTIGELIKEQEELRIKYNIPVKTIDELLKEQEELRNKLNKRIQK